MNETRTTTIDVAEKIRDYTAEFLGCLSGQTRYIGKDINAAAYALAIVACAINGLFPVHSLGTVEKALYENDFVHFFAFASQANTELAEAYAFVMYNNFPYQWWKTQGATRDD